MKIKNDRKAAKTAREKPRRIVIVAFDGAQDIDIAGPASVFARANEFAPNAYAVTHASPEGGDITLGSGLKIAELKDIQTLRGEIDTILVTGGTEQALRSVISAGRLPKWLKKMAPKTKRVGSVCTGAFILAASGLLDNHRAVTHWASCKLLQAMHPSIEVDANAIFVHEGRFFTSAGVSAAIDAALLLVEEDLGRTTAAQVAKSMVLFLRRSGGQSQYSRALAAQSNASGDLTDLVSWISENLDGDLSVTKLAERVGMSQRSFMRHFRQEIDMTPAAYIRLARLETACYWLENTQWPIKKIAKQAGFGSTDSLERAVRRQFDTTCAVLRDAYGASASSRYPATGHRNNLAN
ncbi:MAG: GlxA family transcriptional regulator [Halioglobus sp.]